MNGKTATEQERQEPKSLELVVQRQQIILMLAGLAPIPAGWRVGVPKNSLYWGRRHGTSIDLSAPWVQCHMTYCYDVFRFCVTSTDCGNGFSSRDFSDAQAAWSYAQEMRSNFEPTPGSSDATTT